MIVRGVEAEIHPVAWRRSPAAREAVAYIRGVAHDHLHRDVDVAVVVRDADGRLLGRRLHVVGLVLLQVRDDLGALPGLIVYPPVQADRRCAVDAQSMNLFPDFVRDGRLVLAGKGLGG